MKTSFKYGVSAIALLAAISLAQAQNSERQGGAASGSEMGGRGGEFLAVPEEANPPKRSAAKVARPASIKASRLRNAVRAALPANTKENRLRKAARAAPPVSTKESQPRSEARAALPASTKESQPRSEARAALPASTQESQLRSAARAALPASTKESQPRNAVKEAPRVRKSSSAGSLPSAIRTTSRASLRRGTGPKIGQIANANGASRVRKAEAAKQNSAAARETVKGLAAPEVNTDGSPASLANKRPGYTAYWCATAPSTAITGLM